MPFIKKGILAFTIVVLVALSWLLITPTSSAITAPIISVDESFERFNITDRSDHYLTPLNATYLDVLASTRAMLSDIPEQRDNRLWYVSTVENNGYSDIPLMVNIDRLNLDDLQLYLVDQNQRIIKSYRYEAGKGDYSLAKPIPTIRFAFTLTTGSHPTLLIGIKDDGLRHFPISLWHKDALSSFDRQLLSLFGVVMGTLSILTGYFLLSYLYQRTPARFWFAMTNGAVFFLFFVVQGGLASWPALTNTSEMAVALLLSISFLMMAKVTHNLFLRIPPILRVVNFLLPSFMAILSLTSSPYQAVITLFWMCPVIGLFNVFLAMTFKDERNLGSSRLFSIAWMCMFLLYALMVEVIFNGITYTTPLIIGLISLLTVAQLCLGFSVELKERTFNLQQISEREATINSLNYFFDLFRNSAEGLYTSTLEGTLKTVNPAMCALFGYKDEQSMLAAVNNTRQFYADEGDRDLLVGELLDSGQVMGREIKGVRANGNEFWFSISCQVRKNEKGNFLYGSIIDVTEKKQSDISLKYLATHDTLTGVYNRRQFENIFRERLADDSELPLCLLNLDLDRFKVVNDTCGHKAGDALIKELAHQLQKVVTGDAILARLGGDEFGVLVADRTETEVKELAESILNAVQSFRFMWENRIFNLGVSIGLILCDDKSLSHENYLVMADAACYFAKEQGRNQVHQYNKNDEGMLRYKKELDWISTINQALSENQFVLYYQPLRPLNKPNDGYYYEVLLRLNAQDSKVIEPAAFLPTAERFEMNVNIDKWVITNTFRWLSENPEHVRSLRRCSINLNCHSLADRDFKLFVLNAFENYQIPYDKICFEVIESVAIIKMEDTLNFMETFNNLGCAFALDDFGSGFSSYNYLKSLPVSEVKIDGTFIKDMLFDTVDAAMVSSIKDVAKSMGMKTVAEFVENDALMAQLGKMGVDFAQGYGIAPPKPLNEFTPL